MPLTATAVVRLQVLVGAKGEVPDDLELPEGLMRQLQQVCHTVLQSCVMRRLGPSSPPFLPYRNPHAFDSYPYPPTCMHAPPQHTLNPACAATSAQYEYEFSYAWRWRPTWAATRHMPIKALCCMLPHPFPLSLALLNGGLPVSSHGPRIGADSGVGPRGRPPGAVAGSGRAAAFAALRWARRRVCAVPPGGLSAREPAVPPAPRCWWSCQGVQGF